MHRRSFFGRMIAGVAAWLGWHSAEPLRGLYETHRPVTPGVFPICRADVPNSNGNLYTRKALEDLAKRMEGQTVPVCLDGLPKDTAGIPVSHLCGTATLHMDGEYLMARVSNPVEGAEYRTWLEGMAIQRDDVLVVTEISSFTAVQQCRAGWAVDMHPDRKGPS